MECRSGLQTVLVTRLELWTATGGDPVDAWLDANLDLAAAALDRLDGFDTTQLWLDNDGTRLGVAGGPDRFFVGYVEASGATYEARDLGSEGTGAEIIIGGQPTSLPATHLVSRAAALGAVSRFVTDGVRSPDLHWVRD